MSPSIHKDIYILGISAFYHDSAAALIKNGRIIAAAQEERFTRKKHDPAFPRKAIAYCLGECGITANDLTHVVFYEKPFLKFERLLYTYLSYAPLGLRSFLKAMPLWMKQKIFLKDLIANELKYKGEILFTGHHESHAASAFFPSPFQKAAILTIDGVGEWTTASYGIGHDNTIELKQEIRFPHSLGLLYSAFTYFTGFRVNSGEYKLMGLAPYGEPKYVDLITDHLIDIKDDGSFRLDMKYFNYCAGLTMVNKRFEKLFGLSPRQPEGPLTQEYMDIARSIQAVTEDIMLKAAKHIHTQTQMDNLCLAGGVALNCVGNGRMLRESPFKNIWIQPAAGDAGGALGAALCIWHRYLDKSRLADNVSDQQGGSYLGPEFKEDVIETFVRKHSLPHEKLSDEDAPQRVAALINNQKVIGLLQGRMEFGPRALGCRSIIADARSLDMQSVLNLKIKFRESFRPFAPSVLEEECAQYFDLNDISPYMLLVADVTKDKQTDHEQAPQQQGLDLLKTPRSVIPAVTHVDYSARIQTVSQKTNPRYYRIIEEFFKLSGCPVIINTSFNIRGEPIVCTPEEAYRCFMCTNMDWLLLGDFLLEKDRQPDKEQYKKGDISTILD